ncbi:MAG TPA: hypothetical protein VFP80_14620 [Thermoanaerobaculia bacterium]|nr:hypothetical protein [Thermoanaerobaculia bacterium]
MTAKNSIARTQNRRVLITTPFPTPEEVAAAVGLSPERHAELKQMIAEIRAESERRAARRRTSAKPRAAKPAKKK